MKVYVLEQTLFTKSGEEVVFIVDVYESEEDAINYLNSTGFHLNIDKSGYENEDMEIFYYRIIQKELIEKTISFKDIKVLFNGEEILDK